MCSQVSRRSCYESSTQNSPAETITGSSNATSQIQIHGQILVGQDVVSVFVFVCGCLLQDVRVCWRGPRELPAHLPANQPTSRLSWPICACQSSTAGVYYGAKSLAPNCQMSSSRLPIKCVRNENSSGGQFIIQMPTAGNNCKLTSLLIA